MIYLILGAICLALLGGTMWKLDSNGYTRGKAACQQEILTAQKKAEEEGAKREREAAAYLDQLGKTFAAGEAKQKARDSASQQKGAQNVATAQVFRNPSCVLDADSLRDLNDARSNLRTTADSGKSISSMFGTSDSSKR